MKLRIALGHEELNALVIAHLKDKIGIEIEADDIRWESYGGCEIGRYTMIEVPPKPKKAPPRHDPVPVASEPVPAEIVTPAAPEEPESASEHDAKLMEQVSQTF